LARQREAEKECGFEAHVALDESDEEPILLMVTTHDEEFMSENWLLDTGCSNHMIGHKKYILNLDTSKKSNVRLADDNTIKATKIGDIVIKKVCLYVPRMKCNLLSVGQLAKKGFSVNMKG